LGGSGLNYIKVHKHHVEIMSQLRRLQASIKEFWSLACPDDDASKAAILLNCDVETNLHKKRLKANTQCSVNP